MLLPEAAPALASSKRYVIERELGQGGMGVVYQALDLERRTRVALKAITHRDAITIYRLKNEFRQLADLSHPNLVTLHELSNEGSAWFFTMELVNGSPFDQYCNAARSASLPPEPEPGRRVTSSLRVLRDVSITLSQRKIGGELPLRRSTCNMRRLRNALRQLVEGVAALHDAGKLHRDLKPSNVLVTPEGRVVVLDFGLVSNGTFIDAASQEADRTIGGSMFGTPAYMSPEQAAGEAVTPASDWYSIGTMLYEALTGELPFDGTVVEILRRKDEGEPPPPSELVTDVPDDLDYLCREMLRRDPRRRPNAGDLLRYLTGHSSPPPAYDAQSSPRIAMQTELFVGRSEHLAALRDAFETAKGGTPVTVLVHGVSGIGKSALVRHFANELIRAEEAVVLRGRCYERENVPYKAFDNIVDALSRYLMRLPAQECAEILPRNVHALAVLFPVLRRVNAIAHARKPKQLSTDAREQRNQAFGALKELLLRISDFHPLVINIDDLQWADIDSARLLSFLLGSPDPPPLLLVGTYRRDEVQQSPFLTQILSDRGLGAGAAQLRELPVDALSAEEGEALAGALLEDAQAGHGLLHGAIAAEGEGVPFFITELVQHLRLRSNTGRLPVNVEPISLEQVLSDRVASMPAGAQRLLEVLSVAGGLIEQGVAIEAAGLSRGDRSALLALRAARLIRTRGTRENDLAETYHDRVRETVSRALDAQRRRELHGRIAQVLERSDLIDPERLVMHYSGAGDGVRAGETAIEAAHAAARKLAFNRAGELYAKAIALLPPGDAKRRSLYEHMGEALANSGRGAQAAEAFLAASDGLERPQARELRRRAAQQYLRSGRVEQGMGLATELLREVGVPMPASTTSAIAALLSERARLAFVRFPEASPATRTVSAKAELRTKILGSLFKEYSALDPLLGSYLQARFLREAMREGRSERLLEGLAWDTMNTAFSYGERKRRRVDSLLALTKRIAKEVGTPYAEATAALAEAGADLALGAPEHVEAKAGLAERLFQEGCQGASWEAAYSRMLRYAGVELNGDLQTFSQEAQNNERDAHERGDQFAIGSLTLVVPMTEMMRDAPEAALQHLRLQRARLPQTFTFFHVWVMDRTVDALLYAGQVEAAAQDIDSTWPEFERSFLSRAELLRVNGAFLRGRVAVAQLELGPNAAAQRVARASLRYLNSLERADARTYASLIAAGVAQVQGDTAGARRALHLAERTASSAKIGNFALYARRNLAWLDSAGQQTDELAALDGQMRALGITCPARWLAAYAPGFEAG